MDPGPARAQRLAVEAERRRIARGERPTFHATWAVALDGAADVRIVELPLVHLFAPSVDRALDAARILIAQTLGVDPLAFDVEPADGPRADPLSAWSRPPRDRRR